MNHQEHSPGLYIVATPIGNLQDITIRAVDILRQVDLILCEDTRKSSVLLKHHGIQGRCMALHRFNEASKIDDIIARIKAGQRVAIISDAGTPLIQDPGGRLVSALHAHHLSVIPLPGPSSVMAALSAAGFVADHFEFFGFLPEKSHARKQLIETWIGCQHPLVCFEAPHRIKAAAKDFCDILGGHREIVMAREITKKYETILRFELEEWLKSLTSGALVQKGEWVLILGPDVEYKKAGISDMGQQLMTDLQPLCPLKQAVSIVARATGDAKNKLYEFGLTLTHGDS